MYKIAGTKLIAVRCAIPIVFSKDGFWAEMEGIGGHEADVYNVPLAELFDMVEERMIASMPRLQCGRQVECHVLHHRTALSSYLYLMC